MGVLDWICLILDRNSWKTSMNMVISLKFCKREFLVVKIVYRLFIVEMK